MIFFSFCNELHFRGGMVKWGFGLCGDAFLVSCVCVESDIYIGI